MQLRDVPGDIFSTRGASSPPSESLKPNEIVVRVQPGEAVYVKLNVKKRGMAFAIDEMRPHLRQPIQGAPPPAPHASLTTSLPSPIASHTFHSILTYAQLLGKISYELARLVYTQIWSRDISLRIIIHYCNNLLYKFGALNTSFLDSTLPKVNGEHFLEST